MQYGPDLIIACPNCNFLMKMGTIMSQNTFHAVFWSDGKCIGPMFQDRSLILKCYNCGSFFWDNSLNIKGRIDLASIDWDRLRDEIRNNKFNEKEKEKIIKWNALKKKLPENIKQEIQAKKLKNWHDEFIWFCTEFEKVLPIDERWDIEEIAFPDIWINAPSPMGLGLNDHIKAINDDNIINSDIRLNRYSEDVDLNEKEIYLRKRLWWFINDTIRNNEQEEIPESLINTNRENLGKLLQILSDKKSEHIIMKAEIYRQLGDFNKAINYISNMPIPEEYQSITREIRNHAETKKSKLFKMPESKP